MNALLGVGEGICGILISLFTIPMLFVGLFTGMRGMVRYLKIKSM
jgi:hypothetical protein